jgi:hypothetical protein
MRKCWTCSTEHDVDEPCARSDFARSSAAAGGSASQLFGLTTGFGTPFTASFDSDDDCCGAGIWEGEQIRSDGDGGWIHADATCERLAS